jgi:hypothetical protein
VPVVDLRRFLVIVYARACSKGGLEAKLVYFVTGAFVGFVSLGMTVALTRFSCTDFATMVVLPFLMKQPLALLGAPFIYAFKNSFGGGPGVDGILAAYEELELHDTPEELRAALREHGRAVDNPWLDDGVEGRRGGLGGGGDLEAAAESPAPAPAPEGEGEGEGDGADGAESGGGAAVAAAIKGWESTISGESRASPPIDQSDTPPPSIVSKLRRFGSLGLASKRSAMFALTVGEDNEMTTDHSQAELKQMLKDTVFVLSATPSLRKQYAEVAKTIAQSTHEPSPLKLAESNPTPKPLKPIKHVVHKTVPQSAREKAREAFSLLIRPLGLGGVRELGVGQMLVTCQRKRKYIKGNPMKNWRIRLTALDELLRRVPPAVQSIRDKAEDEGSSDLGALPSAPQEADTIISDADMQFVSKLRADRSNHLDQVRTNAPPQRLCHLPRNPTPFVRLRHGLRRWTCRPRRWTICACCCARWRGRPTRTRATTTRSSER